MRWGEAGAFCATASARQFHERIGGADRGVADHVLAVFVEEGQQRALVAGES